MNSRIPISDTTLEAEAVQLEIIRAMEPSERARRALQLTSQVIRQAKEAIRRRHPEFTDREAQIKFIELHYGADLARAVGAHWESRHE